MSMTKVYLSLLLSLVSLGLSAQTKVTHLRNEYQENPPLVDIPTPRLSWQLTSKVHNILQAAYRILVADDPKLLRHDIGNMWDSKKIQDGRSIQVAYAGKELAPLQKYYWKVMIWDNRGTHSIWSESASWQMGLLNRADWQGAQWIAYDSLPVSMRIVPALHGNGDPSWGDRIDTLPLLRKDFSINKKIKKAMIYICGLGQFELSLNGHKVGDHFLDPGWTQYDKHALYVAFDLTRQLQAGKNALGVMLGNGFYYIPSERYRKITGAHGYPKIICRLVLQYADGTTDNILSDGSWKAAPGPVTFSSIYGGEDYDATREQAGWDKPGFNDEAWKQVKKVQGPPQLDAQMAEPLKVFDHLPFKKVCQPKKGAYVYDLGQNASGIPYLRVKGKKGMVVKLTPGELLTDSGWVTQEAIGQPVYFQYTLKGEGTETWQPRFMYYGFRYVQVEGAVPKGEANPEELPEVEDIEGLHTRNAAARIGKFTCSNDLFNKTFDLINWAIESNMASIFTDCPHREKLGWLEEAHLVGSSIRYNYDIAGLCRKIIRDMKIAQTPEGLIPDIAPEFVQFEGGFRDSPEWGSNGIIMPWYVYQWFGDRQILEESYDMMVRYATYLDKRSKGHILNFGLGDWYDLGPKPPGESQLTTRGLTATAFFYYDLTILSRIARFLEKNSDALKYEALGKEVKGAFNQAFFNPQTQQYGTGSQTANAMAVYMELVEPRDKAAVINNIVKDIRGRKNSLTAGDIGYRYLLRVLDDAGRSDVIYDMNSRTDVPGYGYQLAHGATALTESWQAYPNASNNHFMLGHLMEWFYSGLGGIRPAPGAVAFREIDIRPEPVAGMEYAAASYQSPYGLISTQWKRIGKTFQLNVEIPANTRANISLPAGPRSVITESDRPVKENQFLSRPVYRDGRVVYKAGSGVYSFLIKEEDH